MSRNTLTFVYRRSRPRRIRGDCAGAGACGRSRSLKALETMSAHLRGLKSFQVESSTTTDEVLEDGLAVQYSANVNFLVQMPNRARVDVTSDRNDRRYVYDGKSFTLYARRIGYYATVPAPATLRELDDVLADKYGIELPLADLFRFGSPRWNAGRHQGGEGSSARARSTARAASTMRSGRMTSTTRSGSRRASSRCRARS